MMAWPIGDFAPYSNLLQANKNHIQDLQTAHDEYTSKLNEQAAHLKLAAEKETELKSRNVTLNVKVLEAEASVAEKETERQAAQSELDDLLMVFGDLEDKSEKYKQRLKELGESVSDGEDGDGDEDEADDGDGVD
jgi:chromosome segregation ATPase